MTEPAPLTPEQFEQLVARVARRVLGTIKVLAVLFFVLYALGIGYTLRQSYKGREDLVGSQRQGCERGKVTAAADGTAWFMASIRAASSYATAVAEMDAPGMATHLPAAVVYRTTDAAKFLRAVLDCSEAYPSPSLRP